MAPQISLIVVERSGLNRKRRVLGPVMKFISNDLEGVETDVPPYSTVCVHVPSMNSVRFCIIVTGRMAGDKSALLSDLVEVISLSAS